MAAQAPRRGPQGTATVASLLSQAVALGLSRLDAQLLIGRALGRSRSALIAHDDEAVPAELAQALHAQFAQRRLGVPVAYLLGEREFHGLSLHITAAVLVPRPETEGLVDWALEVLAGPLATARAPRVLDLGTGSGAIALALKARCPCAQVHAVERSGPALAVAQANGRRLGLQVHWWQGDWFDALPATVQHFDLIVGNPPYVRASDPHLAALQAEPVEALTPGPEGLEALSHIAHHASEHLLDGGAVLLEHGHDQGPAVRALLERAGLHDIQTRRDLAGHERCTGAWQATPARRGAAALPYPSSGA